MPFGALIGQFCEFELVNRGILNCSPWLWQKTKLTKIALRVILTVPFIMPVIIFRNMKILQDLSLFMFGLTMMAVWRYICHQVKLDNIQGYDKEFLSR